MAKTKPLRQPRMKTLKQVEAWLRSYGFRIYGANISEEGEEYPGCRDYTVESAVKVAKLIRKGKTYRVED